MRTCPMLAVTLVVERYYKAPSFSFVYTYTFIFLSVRNILLYPREKNSFGRKRRENLSRGVFVNAASSSSSSARLALSLSRSRPFCIAGRASAPTPCRLAGVRLPVALCMAVSLALVCILITFSANFSCLT